MQHRMTFTNRPTAASTAVVTVLVSISQDSGFLRFVITSRWLKRILWLHIGLAKVILLETLRSSCRKKTFFPMIYGIPNATTSIRWLNWDICLNCINRVLSFPEGLRWTLHTTAIITWMRHQQEISEASQDSLYPWAFQRRPGRHKKSALSGLAPGPGSL